MNWFSYFKSIGACIYEVLLLWDLAGQLLRKCDCKLWKKWVYAILCTGMVDQVCVDWPETFKKFNFLKLKKKAKKKKKSKEQQL